MSHKNQLRKQRKNTIINQKSKKEDKTCQEVVKDVIASLETKFNVKIEWEQRIYLLDIIEHLKIIYPNVSFAKVIKTSFMTPDGGITYLIDKKGNKFPILIGEVKNQGTNDIRKKEGKEKQAKGNAVERLGKNVIGFRTYMMDQGIFPFVCFGDGCDFETDSSILDRVITIAMFGSLNEDHTSNVGPNKEFNRGSYYFKRKSWKYDEMYKIMYDVAVKSIYYYFSLYGEKEFVNEKRA